MYPPIAREGFLGLRIHGLAYLMNSRIIVRVPVFPKASVTCRSMAVTFWVSEILSSCPVSPDVDHTFMANPVLGESPKRDRFWRWSINHVVDVSVNESLSKSFITVNSVLLRFA